MWMTVMAVVLWNCQAIIGVQFTVDFCEGELDKAGCALAHAILFTIIYCVECIGTSCSWRTSLLFGFTVMNMLFTRVRTRMLHVAISCIFWPKDPYSL